MAGAALGTLVTKSDDLLRALTHADDVALHLRAASNEIKVFIGQLRQRLGQVAQGSDEAKAINSSIDGLEEGAVKVDAAATDVELLAVRATELATETKQTVAFVEKAKAAQAVEGGVPIFRVQGGVLPNASEARFVIDEVTGELSIVAEKMLFINVNQEARALEFLAKRGNTAEIIRFEVKPAFVEELRAAAIKHTNAPPPGVPQSVDWTKAADQYGLPSTWFQKLLDNVVPGSVTIIHP